MRAVREILREESIGRHRGRNLDSEDISTVEVNTRLQKGGALLSDMRLLVSAWSSNMAEENFVSSLSRTVPKTTVARVKDTFIRAFKPRFLMGSPPNAWRLARALEDAGADVEIVRPFYYWITARSENLLYSFVRDILYSQSRSAEREVRIDDVVSWVSERVRATGKSWSPTVTRKVSRGLLAALRDFGILEGRLRKRISPANLTPRAFALIAYSLHEMGAEGRGLIAHDDWRLFLLGETGCEHMLLECHQHGWLRYESAGQLCRVEFPTMSFEDYVNVVLAR